MSLVKSNGLQVGQSVTATNNFTMYQPSTPDGTVRIGNGNSGSATDIMTLNSSGNVGIGTSSPTLPLDVSGEGMRINRSAGDSYFSFATSGTNNVSLYGGASTGFRVFIGGSERLRLDTSGNLGLGVTPSAWFGSGLKAMQIGSSAIANYTTTTYLYSNAYIDSAGTEKYVGSGYAGQYRIAGTAHLWYTAPSGTAGNAISFTQAMTLDASGNLGVGTSSPDNYTGRSCLSINGSSGGIFTLQLAGTQQFRGYVNSGSTTLQAMTGTLDVRTTDASALTLSTNSAERMRIDSSGNVVVQGGVSYTGNAPTYRGNVIIAAAGDATSNGGLEFASSSGGGAGYGGRIVTDASANILFLNRNNATAWSERMRINSSGYTKISNDGTYRNATATYHEIRQTANNTGIKINATDSSTYSDYIVDIIGARNTTNGTYYALRYYNEGAAANKFYVIDGGSVYNATGTYGTISDARLKENIVDATPKLDDVMQLQVRNFNLKSIPDEKHIGFVAQEIETVFPGLVQTEQEKDKDGEFTGETTKTVKTTVLIPILVKAIQEQQTIIESLTKRIETLEGA